ncbi:MAG: hypothetical protein BGO77_02315 [Caedibacter sp. 37-49]|nr:MAG: hypothetical protein BGO77_02315 [Caedibacter sp. 37-49]
MFRNFAKSLKVYSTIIGLLAFTPLWASPNDEERRPINQKPTDRTSEGLENLNDAYDWNNGYSITRSYLDKLKELTHSVNDFLSNYRLMWYMGFAGTGCGLLVSNAFDIESQEMYTPWVLGGLAVGLTAGATTKYFINKNCPGADNILKKRGPNIAAGLSSFIPWIIFGATQKHITQ